MKTITIEELNTSKRIRSLTQLKYWLNKDETIILYYKDGECFIRNNKDSTGPDDIYELILQARELGQISRKTEMVGSEENLEEFFNSFDAGDVLWYVVPGMKLITRKARWYEKMLIKIINIFKKDKEG